MSRKQSWRQCERCGSGEDGRGRALSARFLLAMPHAQFGEVVSLRESLKVDRRPSD
jgi:hypothetical protein